MNDETVVTFGGEVKACGDGWFEAPLILFGDASSPDLASDFFTKDTDFWTDLPGEVVLLYNHGLDDTLKSTKLGKTGKATLSLHEDGADAGVWMKGQLNLANRYEAAIYGLVEQKKMGTSSGAVSHLVSRVAEGSAKRITSWPLFEGSLTPEPCEARNFGKVTSMKNLSAPSFKSLTSGQADEDKTPSLKSVFLGKNIENTMTMAAISRLNDALMYSVVSPLLSGDNYGPYFDTMSDLWAGALSVDEKVTALLPAFDEFRDMAANVIRAILSGAGGETAAGAVKSLKQSYADPQSKGPRIVSLLGAEELKSFLTAVGAVAELTERRLSWYDNERSTKQGRPISADNLATMQTIHDGMQGHVAALGAMIDKHKGMAGKDGSGTKSEAVLDADTEKTDTESAARARSVQHLYLHSLYHGTLSG